MEHELKAWPAFFDAVDRGDKTFEVRRDDRGFQVGDTLRLVRWQPDTTAYGGGWPTDREGRKPWFFNTPPAELLLRVTYIMHGGRFGIDPAFCVLGFVKEPPSATDAAATGEQQ